MTELRTELRTASQRVDPSLDAFERLVALRRRLHRRQRAASFITAIVVGAVSLAGVVLLLSRLDDGTSETGAGWQPSRSLTLEPGEYFYLRVTSDEAVDGHRRAIETWWSPDGSGEVRNRSTRQDKYPYPPSGIYDEGAFPQPYDVSSLATDPDALSVRLREGTLEGALELLFEAPYADPELRAALFEVVARLEGVTVIEEARDPAGRPALVVETSGRDGEDVATWRTYFDPGTHQPTAWTFGSTRGGSAWILLESAIVAEAGARPTADQWLVPPVDGT